MATLKVKMSRGIKRISSAWKRASLPVPIRLDSPADDDSGCGENSGDCGHRHSKVVPGYGKKEFPFPSTDDLVRNAIAYFNALAREYEKHGQRLVIGTAPEQEGNEAGDDGASATDGMSNEFLDYVQSSVSRLSRTSNKHGRRRTLLDQARAMARDNTLDDLQSFNLPKSASGHRLIPDGKGHPSESTGNVLRVAAGTLAEILDDGRFLAVIARQFDSFKGAVNWALGKNAEGKYNTPPKYHPVARSLKMHLDKLEDIYGEALPRVMQFLAAQYSNASESELLDAAVAVLNEQLTEILYVLSIWTDSFAQRRDGMYNELEYIHFLLEESLRLILKGGGKTHVYHVEDVFMARYSDQDPATIPAGRGPVGAHAVEVPHYFRPVLLQEGPLFAHEFDHDVYEDVENLRDNSIEAVVNRLKRDDKAGKFKFSQSHVMLGKQKVRMIDVIIQVCAQTLSETHADVAGGILLTGEAYVYCMLSTFGAFNMRGRSPFGANRLLRHSSVFGVTEEGELGFEPHLPDYIRAIFCAAALEAIGFHEEALDCKRLARQAAGRPLPEFIVWRNFDPKSKFQFEIKIPVADLEQVAPAVADAIINAKLPALGGQSHGDLINWNRHRQDKVDALVAILLQGKSDIPWELGDWHPTYVVAACAKASWAVVKDGSLPPKAAILEVETGGRRMMEAVKQHMEATAGGTLIPVGPAAQSDSPAGDAETAADVDETATDASAPDAPAADGNGEAPAAESK